MIAADDVGAFVARYDATFRDVGTVFLAHVAAHVTPECVLVDVGCGRTSYGAEVYAQAKKRIGLDVDPYARENPVMDEVHIMEEETFPLPDACADVVVAQWVVEHVVHPEVFLREVKRVLKPGGVLVFMTTNIRSPMIWLTSHLPTRVKSLFRARVLGYADDETFPTVYAMNTPGELLRLAGVHGFSVQALERIESYGYFRFSSVALRGYIEFARWLRKVTRDRDMHIIGVFKSI